MANSAQARKRARQADKRRVANTTLRSRVRTSIKQVRAQIAKGDAAAAAEAFKAAVPVIDSMVNKGILHANAAARHKKRLNNAVRALG